MDGSTLLAVCLLIFLCFTWYSAQILVYNDIVQSHTHKKTQIHLCCIFPLFQYNNFAKMKFEGKVDKQMISQLQGFSEAKKETLKTN